MIIWGRLGFLVPAIGLGVLGLTEVVAESIAGDETYYQNNRWVILVGTCIVAAILWPLGRWLNKKAPVRTLVDPNTGERVTFQRGGGNTLFFIPMEYWAPIAVAIGLIILLSK